MVFDFKSAWQVYAGLCNSSVLNWINMFIRSSPIGMQINESFFLWGPRQAGKTTLLEERFKDCPYIDFLNSETFMRYQLKPWLLFEEITGLLDKAPHQKALVYHELISFLQYKEINEELSYWKLSSGAEVDFIIGDMKIAIEAKAREDIHSDHLKGLRELSKDHPQLGARIVVSCVPRARKTEDGIWILPYQEFLKNLWSGEFI